jgi:NAD(P)-dependent dehydrogenase (short-subunit alcohol dehydrogenase family)
VVVGRGGGIARAVALLAQSEGARVIVAGRDQAKLANSYSGSDIAAEVVDIADDESIAALADRVGAVDHVVSTASARARGKLIDLQRHDLQQSFNTRSLALRCWPNILPLTSIQVAHLCCSRACTPSN